MRFRPCIDLHNGKVKQIVGSTLSDNDDASVRVNFSSEHSPAYYADLYRRDQLTGGHVIMLGPGSESAARQALQAWPGGLQVGGGITVDNAGYWLDQGASHVIVTSWAFYNGSLDMQRVQSLVQSVGKKRLVLDLSCRKKNSSYFVVTDRWQRFTELTVTPSVLGKLSCFCDEFLVHAVDVEGKSMGINAELLSLLAEDIPLPITYAGGITSTKDLQTIRVAGRGAIDFTVGSALDLFGGTGLKYKEIVKSYGASESPS